VVVSERCKTAREGRIHSVQWHFKYARYVYFLAVPGVNVAERKVFHAYLEEDLAAV
jgi:hypothetical protein